MSERSLVLKFKLQVAIYAIHWGFLPNKCPNGFHQSTVHIDPKFGLNVGRKVKHV